MRTSIDGAEYRFYSSAKIATGVLEVLQFKNKYSIIQQYWGNSNNLQVNTNFGVKYVPKGI